MSDDQSSARRSGPTSNCWSACHSLAETVWPRPWPSVSQVASVISRTALDPIRSVTFYAQNPTICLRELLCGATVSLIQVPESIAFSFVAHLQPFVGMYSTFFIGLITACLGGKPAMISGMAGAMMVVAGLLMLSDGDLAGYTYEERFQHLTLTVCLTGVIQLIISLLGLARFLRLVPRPVHVGFLNGLGIVIFIAQLDAFKTCHLASFFECSDREKQWMRLTDGATWLSLLLVAVTMVIVVWFPRLPRVGKVVPSSLVALAFCTMFEHLINRPFIHLPTRAVGQTASVAGPGPHWQVPIEPASGWKLGIVLQYAVRLAIIGTVESLMALQALNRVTKSPQTMGQFHQECAGQGVGNVICGLFGTAGGSIMIGQATVNILSGARGRLSGITAAVLIILYASFAGPVIDLIPIPSLTGVLFIVIIKTFDWGTFKTIPRIPLFDTFIISVVTILAVITDLAIAVVVGVVIASLGHAWNETSLLTIHVTNSTKHRTQYDLHGKLNFATAWTFESFFTERASHDVAHVIVDFTSSSISDYSALHAIYKAVKEYHNAGKRLRLQNLDQQSTSRLRAASKLINKGNSVVELELQPLEEDIQEPMAQIGGQYADYPAVPGTPFTVEVEERGQDDIAGAPGKNRSASPSDEIRGDEVRALEIVTPAVHLIRQHGSHDDHM